MPVPKLIEPGHTEQFFAFRECQDRLKSILTKSWEKSYVELTGLRLHVFWRQPLDWPNPDVPLVFCPAARAKTHGDKPPAACMACLQRHWPNPALPAGQGRRFTGPCGNKNFCLLFQAAPSIPSPLALVLQTQSHQPTSGLASKIGSGPSSPCSPRAQFKRAVTLLRMLTGTLEADVREWLARRELELLRHQLQVLEAEKARSGQNGQNGQIPWPERTSPDAPLAPGNRAQQIVQAMIGYLHQHFHRPLSLDDIAAALKMNASYLSSLFSQTQGITLHRYLEEFRMSKAREMLRDPSCRICEVAYSVGYTSPDQFRHVFRLRFGVPPSAWRLRGGA